MIRWFAIALGFAGTLVIIQPGAEAFRPAALWGVAAAPAAATTGMLARHLGSTEPASVTSFYTTVAFLMTVLIPVAVVLGYLVFGDIPTFRTWVGMGLIACAGVLLAQRA